MSSEAPAEAKRYVRKMRLTGIRRWLPCVNVLESYKREWLVKDFSAGIVLSAFLVPVGMGYAEAAGLPVIYGLYASIVPLIAYAIFGPSRILVVGPDSSLAAIIAATILPLSGGNSGNANIVAAMLAVFSGGICVIAGVAKFGFITDLLSSPIRCGYLNAIALTILIGQIPKILGFSVDGHNLAEEVQGIAAGIAAGKTNLTALVIGLACLVVIFTGKKLSPKFPGVLIAVFGATIYMQFFGSESSGVAVVGKLPQGLPQFVIPKVEMESLLKLSAGAAAIALVSFADMSVISRKFASRGRYEIDDNQELFALGVTNIAAGLFQGFSITSSASRTPVAEAAGAQTQLTSVFAAICIAVLLMIGPNLLMNVPTAALAAVVVAACFSLVEIHGVTRLWQKKSPELWVTAICFFCVALIGVLEGIFIAIALSLLSFIKRAWTPYSAVLGRVDGLKGYHDIVRHPEARRIPGLVLIRWDAPIFFANVRIFEERVKWAIESSPDLVRCVVVAAEPVTDIDITAADMLTELDEELKQFGIELWFAEVKGPVKDQLKKLGHFKKLGENQFFPTIGLAVDHYVEEYKIDWTDWEDAPS
ncbi:MAG: SulP family inorganic anion transporter [Candidatus Obscuribacterales bacterium]|nr:SulP family inorganic anion transporter [Candidatus Obscuribacterales bacterium]